MSSLISSTGSSSLRPFTTVYGRGLLEEVKFIANRKYVIVTMEDLWKIPSFPSTFASDSDNYEVYFVKSLEAKDLKAPATCRGKLGTNTVQLALAEVKQLTLLSFQLVTW